MQRWGDAQLIRDLRTLTVPPIWGTNVFLIFMSMVNEANFIYSLFTPAVLVNDFGPIFENYWTVVLWFTATTWLMPGFAASLSMLMSIAYGLRRELRSVELRVIEGDMTAAEQAYGRFVKFMFITRKIYQPATALLLLYCIVTTSIVVIKEIDLVVDGKPHTLQQSVFGVMALATLCILTAPLVDLPTRHARLKVTVAEYSSSGFRKDVVQLLCVLNAMQDHAGMKIGGIMITKSFLVRVISYISVVMSVLKRVE
eukprot:TRINITY_DN30367_c0_g1_i5.p1 TRINITY_DN30367_c0_g1~~TRINITY_DN30367_c0_g1_i5.p1  ORF type:complete len:255 (+),score=22.52 TRINITY_DN30367_c0_g1_i5:387-1151(+)